MKRFGGAVAFGLSLGALAIVACGGGSSGTDPASVAKELQSPSGTLEPTKSGDLANSAADQQDNAQAYGGVFSLFGGGSMSSASATQAARTVLVQSVKPLGDSASFGSGISCDVAGASSGGSSSGGSASINCTCEGGGSAKIDVKVDGADKVQTGPYSADMKFSFNGCKTSSVLVDGNFHFYTDAPKGALDTASVTVVYTGNFTYQQGTDAPKSVEFAYGMLQNEMYILVKTPEGSFAVNANPWDRTTKTGTVKIKDKTGLHTCIVTNGDAKCDGSASAGGDAG